MRIKKAFIAEVIAALFIMLFVYAALNKLITHEKFVTQIGQSPLLAGFSQPVSWGIPAVEFIIAGLLAVPRTRLIGLHTSFFLMVMFTSYIVAILTSGYNIPCACGGIIDRLQWRGHLVFNTGFVLLSLCGILLQAKTCTVTATKPLAQAA